MIVSSRRRSTSTRSASAPAAIRPLPGRPKTRAGPALVRSTTRSSSRRPLCAWSRSRGSSVCTPVIPDGVSGYSWAFSSGRVGSVVRAHDVHDPRAHRGPKRLPVTGVPDGRVHLGSGAQALVAFGSHQGQMLRRHLDRGEVAVRGQESHLFGRGDVKDVDAPAQAPRQGEKSRGRAPGRLGIAPEGMRLGPSRCGQRLALAQARLVLGVKGHAARRAAQHRPDAVVVGHEQLAGGRAHEDLHPRATRKRLEGAQLGCVVGGGAHVEGVVAVHPPAGPLELVAEGGGSGGGRAGVGHLEDAGHSPQDGRGAARGQVFLVGEAGLAEVHLGVDDPGQDVQASCLDPLRRP